MDIQFYGANCVSLTYKSTRLVVDDNLQALGGKQIIKPGNVALFTTPAGSLTGVEPKIVIDCPGEYEVSDISIVGIPARAHIDEEKTHATTMYKITTNELDILVTGNIYPSLSDTQIETIGMCDVLILPVGGNGYTLDAQGALAIIKELEPKLVIPTHYEIKGINYPVPQSTLTDVLKEIGMEPRETMPKLRVKPSELSDVTQLVVLEVA